MDQIQEEKCLLADKAKELMDRHVHRLNLEIKRLEEEGQIIPLPTVDLPAQESTGTVTPVVVPTTAVVTNGIPLVAPEPIPPIRVIPPLSAPPSHATTPTPRDKKRKATSSLRRDSTEDIAADEDSQTYCFCQQVSFGEMVACDNDGCEREWFHLPCVGLSSPPQGTWFCEECVVKMAGQRRDRGEKKRVR
jgi:Histone-lysine N-methyltransferase NSD-like, PHD zinc finger 1